MAYIFLVQLFCFLQFFFLNAVAPAHFKHVLIEDTLLHEESFHACERIAERIMIDIELMMHDDSLQHEWLSSDYCLEQMLYLHRTILKLLQVPEEINTFLADDIFSLQQLLYEIAQPLEKMLKVQAVDDYKRLCFLLIIAEAQVILNYIAIQHKEQILNGDT